MEFFNSGFFWLIEGIFLCLVTIGFKMWMEDRAVQLSLWKWVLFVIWVFLFGFTIAFIGTSLGENEITSATKGGLLFGLITVISGAGLWRLLNTGTESDEQ